MSQIKNPSVIRGVLACLKTLNEAQLLTNQSRTFGRETCTILGLDKLSIYQILHHDLHYHQFKLAITQSLKSIAYYVQKSFTETMLDKTDNNRFNVKNMTMSDEKQFHLEGAANEQNCHYWAPSSDNPHIINEKPLHNLHLTVWAGIAV